LSQYRVEDLNPTNEGDWERFNDGWENGSFFHSLRWKGVVERSFGLRARYFLVFEGESPVALCPFFESPLKRWNALISLPVGDIRHLAIATPTEQEVARLVVSKAISIAKGSRLSSAVFVTSSVEARDSIANVCPLVNQNPLEYPVAKVPFLDLEKHSPTDIWENVFDSKKSQRKYIKRFENSGFVIGEGRSASDLDSFYKHYSENLEHIGAKPCGRSHLEILLGEYSEGELRMTLLQRDGEVAGGLIALFHPPQKTMYLRYLALNRGLPSTYHPPYPLFWDAVNYAYEHGFRWVCFGSSSADPDVRSHQIKMGFGCDYRAYYGQMIGMSVLLKVAYRSYMWSRGVRNRGPASRARM
jgi:hypothetical protein